MHHQAVEQAVRGTRSRPDGGFGLARRFRGGPSGRLAGIPGCSPDVAGTGRAYSHRTRERGGQQVSELIAVGAAAPDFDLAASDGRTYRLAELLKAGSVLLVFYPGNNTPG
ncbi:MAG: redoxin domain-containing protein [Gemmatimonadetes bacterium]|nr:redoxin domain-containing protein [Gemmatimonadota bacterium]